MLDRSCSLINTYAAQAIGKGSILKLYVCVQPLRILEMQYANIGKRFLAFLLDLIISFVLASIVYALLLAFFSALLTSVTTSSEASNQLGFLILIVVGWLYHSINHNSPRQATLGKRAFELIVCDLNGNKISFARATGRYFAFVFFTLSALADFLPVPFTQKSQALHDLIAGTVVIEKNTKSQSQ
ncbi:RDD family protein [Microseira sp. BLCC-F43]|uniref:RDD family protein n=1 Tax=Microseira sp. BLCC-F43 TaxID=3153602 RepID=UPI0035B865FE